MRGNNFCLLSQSLLMMIFDRFYKFDGISSQSIDLIWIAIDSIDRQQFVSIDKNRIDRQNFRSILMFDRSLMLNDSIAFDLQLLDSLKRGSRERDNFNVKLETQSPVTGLLVHLVVL
jgi:hypothetical protein